MKKYFVFVLFFSFSLMLLAQPKVKRVESSDYDRNSLSIIVVNRGDQWDHSINDFLSQLVIDEKFDVNEIPLTVFRVNNPDRRNPIGQEMADKLMAESGVVKQVLAYIFNRQSDGSMDDVLLRKRGLYNAKDQDVLNSSVAKVHEQYLEWGEKLIDGSYVVVLDFWNLSKDTSAGTTNYYAWIDAYAYKLDCDRQKLDDFYRVAWADPASSASEKAAARKGFDEFQIGFVPIATVFDLNSSLKSSLEAVTSILSNKGNTNYTAVAAMTEAYSNVMHSLEKKIPGWRVAVPVVGTNPILAKIGKKEGVKNGQRFRAFSYSEDKYGNLVSNGEGYLRATVIADNIGVATGNSETSQFCQISGIKEIQEGWTIKQSNDFKVSAAFEPRVGGFSRYSVNFAFDYLFHIYSSGNCFYGLLNLGADPEAVRFKKGLQTYSFIFGAGAAYGFRLNRMMEVAPYLTAGLDFVAATIDGDFTGRGVYYFEPGVRFSVSFYPLSLYVKGFYDLLRDGRANQEQGFYWAFNSSLKHPHKSGAGLALGVRWAF